MAYGLYLLWLIPNAATGRGALRRLGAHARQAHAAGWHPFAGSPVQIYVGFVALVVNLVVAVLVTLALRAGHVARREDATHPADYHADEGSERLRPVATAVAGTPTEPFLNRTNDHWTAPRYRSPRRVFRAFARS
jgi:SSS family solute:Na+ symporter